MTSNGLRAPFTAGENVLELVTMAGQPCECTTSLVKERYVRKRPEVYFCHILQT
jgi:hypothetical protein